MQEEEKEIKKVFYQLMKQRNVREEAGKGKKSYSKVHREAEGRGGEVWPVEITVWVIGRVTAAIDPLIGCLTVSTRLPNPLIQGVSNCVWVCALVFFLCV